MNAIAIASVLFALGIYGVLTRRDVIGVLASVEVAIGAALVLLVALGAMSVGAGDARIAAAGVLLLVLAAAEAAVGLALVVVVARRSRTTRVDELTEVKG